MPEGESKSKRFRGTVLWYTAKKKMGFIKPDEPDASDIFVHDSDLRPGTGLLSEGDAVEYGLAIFRGRNKAVDVILVGDGAPAPPSPRLAVPGDARARVTGAPLSHDEAIAFVTSDDCGAVATFLGVTRDTFEGKRVVRLYEASAAAAAPGPSTGRTTVPIWKKEIYAEGDPAWKQNKEWDPHAGAASTRRGPGAEEARRGALPRLERRLDAAAAAGEDAQAASQALAASAAASWCAPSKARRRQTLHAASTTARWRAVTASRSPATLRAAASTGAPAPSPSRQTRAQSGGAAADRPRTAARSPLAPRRLAAPRRRARGRRRVGQARAGHGGAAGLQAATSSSKRPTPAHHGAHGAALELAATAARTIASSSAVASARPSSSASSRASLGAARVVVVLAFRQQVADAPPRAGLGEGRDALRVELPEHSPCFPKQASEQ
ncbi:hypothetical protein JL721_9478 [Aureococcus anophagefferens]|nr:hypothetical protein JL721_9478 [Aureococcus anophagefferens]